MGSIVVTGASSGIGRAVTVALAQAGLSVFGSVRSDEDAADIATLHPLITPIRFDVTDAAAIAAATAEIDELVGEAGLDGLVNNAGIAVAGPLELVPLADLRAQLEVNVIGQLAVTQALLPALARASGRIVHIGSPSGRIALPMLGPYAISKFGLVALNDSLRTELSPAGIHVAIVEPSGVASSIWEKSIRAAEQRFAAAPPERLARYEGLTGRALAMAERSSSQGRSVAPVVKAVVHALTADRPRPRYVVGMRSRFGGFVGTFVPIRLRDRLLRRLAR